MRAVVRGHSGCSTLGVNLLALDGPLDPFYLRVKVAVIVGVILSSPVWLYQIWAFVAPGLYAREKRWGYLFLGTAVPLFLAGVTLAYWSLGRSMHFLLGLTPSGVANLLPVDQYMSFVMAMMLAFGIAFELPLLIVMLNLAGHPDPRAVQEVAPGDDLRGVPDRRDGQSQPGPDDHADPRRRLRGPGRRWPSSSCGPTTGAAPGCTPTRTLAWPTTSCPRSTSTRPDTGSRLN